MLDELGMGGANQAPARVPAAARPVDDPLRATSPVPPEPRVEDPLTPQPPLSEAATLNTIAAGSAPGFGAVFTPVDVAPAARRPEPLEEQAIPDEFLEYEEDFRTHYDEQYASDQARYEDYVPAYRYGATIARDLRYRDRPWDEVEPEARRHWETTSPGADRHVGAFQGSGTAWLGSRDGTSSRLTDLAQAAGADQYGLKAADVAPPIPPVQMA